jgi:AraC-like DNA-binding protein
MSLLSCLDMPLEKAEQEDLLYDLAIALQGTAIQLASVHLPNSTAAMRAREYINENTSSGFSLAHLETVTGHNRWQLSRDFRALFGTSPYRYLISLRLNEARRQMLKGAEIADAAHANGFSDQSHFGRLFKKQYGLTPKAWLAAVHQTAP